MASDALLPPDWVLPSLPNKRYFTTSEAAQCCGLQQHVLRYWEKEFPSLQPTRKKGGRRYFHYNDVVLICFIQLLVHHQGYSIEKARQCLKHYGKSVIVKHILTNHLPQASAESTSSPEASPSSKSSKQTQDESSAYAMLETIKQDLQDLLGQLKRD